MFSDESRFTPSFNHGRVRVWRRQGERYADATVREHNRYGGGSVMVWGGMSLGTRTPLLRVDGNLNGVRYRDEILQPLVLPAIANMGLGAIFQDDNAPAHRARAVSNFLQQNQVNRMVWPACSPDLNPIARTPLGRPWEARQVKHPPTSDPGQAGPDPPRRVGSNPTGNSQGPCFVNASSLSSSDSGQGWTHTLLILFSESYDNLGILKTGVLIFEGTKL